MAQYGTGDLNAPEVMEAGAAEGRAPRSLCERIEEAAHTAHAAGCHLRLLVAACTTQRDHPSFQLRTHSLATRHAATVGVRS